MNLRVIEVVKMKTKELIIKALENNLIVNIAWLRDIEPNYKKQMLRDYKNQGIKFKEDCEWSDGSLTFECQKEFEFKNFEDCKKNILDKLSYIDDGIEVFTAFDEEKNILLTEETL